MSELKKKIVTKRQLYRRAAKATTKELFTNQYSPYVSDTISFNVKNDPNSFNFYTSNVSSDTDNVKCDIDLLDFDSTIIRTSSLNISNENCAIEVNNNFNNTNCDTHKLPDKLRQWVIHNNVTSKMIYYMFFTNFTLRFL